jgi:hypothetical protein
VTEGKDGRFMSVRVTYMTDLPQFIGDREIPENIHE